jgi:transposase
MKRNPDKTDFSDARMLADLTRVGYLPEVWLAPEAIRDLRCLMRYRQSLVQERTKIKLRIHGLLKSFRIKKPAEITYWSKAGVQWLQGEIGLPPNAHWVMKQLLMRLGQQVEAIKTVEKTIKNTSAEDGIVKLLRQEKGIGLITACALRSEIGNFSRFKNGKQFANYLGRSPRNASSGARQADAGLIKTGNKLLKIVLLEAAHCLIRYDKHWQEMALRMKDAGKPYSVIVAAVANRWVRRLFYSIRDKEAQLQLAA